VSREVADGKRRRSKTSCNGIEDLDHARQHSESIDDFTSLLSRRSGVRFFLGTPTIPATWPLGAPAENGRKRRLKTQVTGPRPLLSPDDFDHVAAELLDGGAGRRLDRIVRDIAWSVGRDECEVRRAVSAAASAWPNEEGQSPLCDVEHLVGVLRRDGHKAFRHLVVSCPECLGTVSVLDGRIEPHGFGDALDCHASGRSFPPRPWLPVGLSSRLAQAAADTEGRRIRRELIGADCAACMDAPGGCRWCAWGDKP
jgi:hypothetical protein